jgi:hypothetical protein
MNGSSPVRVAIYAQIGAIVHAVRPVVAVAATGYLVVAVFGLSFFFAKSLWPALQDSTIASVAMLASAPLALALIWPRLRGLKAFGLEVSLAESSVMTRTGLVAAITEHQYFSGAESIILQIENSIVRAETEIVELDLRDGDYWWSTRLYLLAALADDYSAIRAFAFVDQGIERRFVGICRPTAVRKALAKAYPVLAKAYFDITTDPNVMNAPPAERVRFIVKNWVGHPFGGEQNELNVMEKVSKQRLADWLSQADQELLTNSIDWPGVSDSSLLRQIVTDYKSDYVALLRGGGRLDRIVDRRTLAIRIAQESLKS